MNPLYLIILPLFVAFLIPIWEKLIKKFSVCLVFIVELVGLIGIYSYYAKYSTLLPTKIILSGYQPPFGISLYISKFTLMMAGIIYLMAFVVTLYQGVKRREESYKFYIVFLLMLAGLSGLVLTSDIFNLFVFFEITAISSYILVALGSHEDSYEASIKYLIIGSIGSTLLLVGIGFLYSFTGTLNIADIARKLVAIKNPFVDLSILLIFIGLGVKAEIFPLNTWVPDAYQTAHFEIAAFLSSVVPKVALILMLRILLVIYSPALIFKLFLILGILGVLIGEFAAYRQSDVFRMLSYSSIAQMGFIFLILSVGKTAITAAFFYALLHLIVKFFLFFIAGLWSETYGVRTVEEFSGMFYRSPLLAFVFGIMVLTLIGVPPTAGFFAKYYAFLPMLKMGRAYYWVLLLAALAISVEAAYFLRLLQNIYFKKAEKGEEKVHYIPGTVPVLFSIFVIWLSACPQKTIFYINKLVALFTNTQLYIKAILG